MVGLGRMGANLGRERQPRRRGPLDRRARAEAMGARVRARVRERFISVRSLTDYLRVIRGPLAAELQNASVGLPA